MYHVTESWHGCRKRDELTCLHTSTEVNHYRNYNHHQTLAFYKSIEIIQYSFHHNSCFFQNLIVFRSSPERKKKKPRSSSNAPPRSSRIQEYKLQAGYTHLFLLSKGWWVLSRRRLASITRAWQNIRSINYCGDLVLIVLPTARAVIVNPSLWVLFQLTQRFHKLTVSNSCSKLFTVFSASAVPAFVVPTWSRISVSGCSFNLIAVLFCFHLSSFHCLTDITKLVHKSL